ncbi:MAG: MFS transporter [Anaerolineae bacterium]|nr:MFS transporter [Anaerolineae bacterium]
MKHFHFSPAPAGATPVERQNYLNVQIDAIGIGLASAAAPFLPVFLARLGASHFQVGLLTAMPAVTGFLLAIVIGRFLQRCHNIVPWFSGARLLTNLAYALTGIVPFLLPRDFVVPAVLLIWAAVTIPQTVVNIAFSVVMNAVAGPEGRYELMSRRWSILGFTTAITVAIMGQILDNLSFPFNYQLVFLGLSVGGLISFYYSSHIEVPDNEPIPTPPDLAWPERFKGFIKLIGGEPAFVSFTAKQFVYTTGTALATPLFPLYYVHEVHASDTWIGLINTAQTAILLVGYYLWVRQSKRYGGRFVLLCTTFGLALHPALVSFTHQPGWITVFAGLAGIFQAGLNLVFFDELMKTVPLRYSATFVSLAQSTTYLATVAAPLLGTLLADQIGLSAALLLGTLLRLIGFGLFVWNRKADQIPSSVGV